MMRTLGQHVSVGLFGVVAALAAGVGCKGETVIKPDPQTKADLDACTELTKSKQQLIDSLTAENAKCKMADTSAPGDIVVSIEGTALTVKPALPGTPVRPINDKEAGEASKQFIDVVAKSRGAIQKCYEQALRKDASLQARTVTLTVSASFSGEGVYKTSSFAPSLGSAFDECIKAVAAKWALPKNSPAMTFKAQVSLTPS